MGKLKIVAVFVELHVTVIICNCFIGVTYNKVSWIFDAVSIMLGLEHSTR